MVAIKHCEFIFHVFLILCCLCNAFYQREEERYSDCVEATMCVHGNQRVCGLEPTTREIRWFLDACDILEFNCEYSKINSGMDTRNYETNATCGESFKTESTLFKTMVSNQLTVLLLACLLVTLVSTHGPPRDRDNEDISMGRKMGAKWCSMAKVCNHDRVPICGISHAGDVMGFRDLCDMFDYNCIRRRNYKQTACPEDKSILTASRRPTNSFYDDK